MASGIEFLMKNLGIDPEAIKKEMMRTIGEIQSGLQSLNTSLTTINARLERIEKQLGIEQPPASNVEILEPQRRIAK